MIAFILICLPLGFLLNKGAWNIMMLALIGFNQKSEGALSPETNDSIWTSKGEFYDSIDNFKISI